MTDVSAAVEELFPVGGTTNAGRKIGYLNSAAKAAQNDTVIVTNANAVEYAWLTIDADGSIEAVTISGSTITLTDATTGNVSGIVIYK